MTKRLLDLTGKELEAELERIIRKNPSSVREWTEKEILIFQRLKGKVPLRIIAKELGRTAAAVEMKSRRLLSRD